MRRDSARRLLCRDVHSDGAPGPASCYPDELHQPPIRSWPINFHSVIGISEAGISQAGISQVEKLIMVVHRSGEKGSAKSSRARGQKGGKRWVAKVKTASTHPTKGLFTKDASTIARSLASKKVSPKGPSSGMRMLTYFINRGGKGLSAARRRELERAKKLLAARVDKAKASQHKGAA
jgi:hypothetical protein